MSQINRKRKSDTHDLATLVRIFNENGGEKNYKEITRLYNEEMGSDWSQKQITRKMQNVRADIKAGKHPEFQLLTVIPETSQSNNDTGKTVSYLW